jgi:hypothetical protein
MFPNISASLYDLIDAYAGGNAYIENLLENSPSVEVTEKGLQSGFDIANAALPMNSVYQTRTGIANSIYTRSQIAPSKYVSPCGEVICGQSITREAWAAPIYGNSKGFRLNSGNFRFGHVSDQYAMAFGIDTVQAGTRLGVMGIGGWGKSRSSGDLFTTWNESSFGGAYVYSNTRQGNIDLLLTAGYLGMDNDLTQAAFGGNLSGSMTSGMASVSAMLTQTYCLGGLHMAPVVGVEYGYYHQGSMDTVWNNATVFQNGKAHANIVVLPVGVTFNTESRLANGALFTPEFRTRYIANVGDVVSSYNVSMPGSTSSALMATKMADRHAGDIGLGFGLTRGATTLRFDYGYMFSQHYQDQYGSATARWQF